MIASISDVHIKVRGDEAYQLMLSFLKSQEVARSKDVYFLGDIFDLMAGYHHEYFDLFPEFFDEVENLLRKGKNVYYVEGNHDMHLEKLYDDFLSKRLIPKHNFHYHKKFIETSYWGKSFLFCHGDDIELGNQGYKRYRSFIGSPLVQFLAEEVIPYWFIRDVGGQNAEASRRRNKDKYSQTVAREEIKNKFRLAAEEAKKNRDYHFIVAGHSHEKDHYISEEGFVYLNNGFIPKTKSFIVIEDGEPRFVEIS